jgi:hypothetical protein
MAAGGLGDEDVKPAARGNGDFACGLSPALAGSER